MRPVISVSTSHEDQARAASFLSEHLTEMGCSHAFIGGFAWSLLGSRRPTEDIDILIETPDISIQDIRKKLSELDHHFALLAGLKFYFVKDLDPELANDQDALIRRSKDNVLIETLSAGTMGLPVVAGPTYAIDHFKYKLIILHSSILILTKLKRWTVSFASTRPKTISKTKTDRSDIEYLIYWLSRENLRIEFDEYQGKSKSDLLAMVKQFHDRYEDNMGLMQTLRSIMHTEDWNEMMGPGLDETVVSVQDSSGPEGQHADADVGED